MSAQATLVHTQERAGNSTSYTSGTFTPGSGERLVVVIVTASGNSSGTGVHIPSGVSGTQEGAFTKLYEIGGSDAADPGASVWGKVTTYSASSTDITATFGATQGRCQFAVLEIIGTNKNVSVLRQAGVSFGTNAGGEEMRASLPAAIRHADTMLVGVCAINIGSDEHSTQGFAQTDGGGSSTVTPAVNARVTGEAQRTYVAFLSDTYSVEAWDYEITFGAGAAGAEAALIVVEVTPPAALQAALSDLAAATDAIARAKAVIQAVADDAPSSDIQATSSNRPRAMSDTAGATDGLERAAVRARATTDSAPATDGLVRLVADIRGVSDSASASDAIENTSTHPRELSDTAAAADAIARVAGTGRALGDSAPASDAVARQPAYARRLEDIADALCTAYDSFTRRPSEAAPSGQFFASDAAGWTVAGGVAFSNTGARAYLDTTLANVDLELDILPDATPFTGLLVKRVDANNYFYVAAINAFGLVNQIIIGRIVAGAATVVGNSASNVFASPALVHLRATVDGGKITGYCNGVPVVTYTMSAGELATFGGSTAHGLAHFLGGHPVSVDHFRSRALTERDVPTRAVVNGRSLADAAAAIDAAAGATTHGRALGDSASATDGLTRLAASSRGIEDAAAVTDGLIRAAAASRQIEDDSPASDAVVRDASLLRSLSDGAPANDAIDAAQLRVRSISDEALAADAIARSTAVLRVLLDDIDGPDDGIGRSATFSRSLVDEARASDVIIRSRGAFLEALGDGASLSLAPDAAARSGSSSGIGRGSSSQGAGMDSAAVAASVEAG